MRHSCRSEHNIKGNPWLYRITELGKEFKRVQCTRWQCFLGVIDSLCPALGIQRLLKLQGHDSESRSWKQAPKWVFRGNQQENEEGLLLSLPESQARISGPCPAGARMHLSQMEAAPAEVQAGLPGLVPHWPGPYCAECPISAGSGSTVQKCLFLMLRRSLNLTKIIKIHNEQLQSIGFFNLINEYTQAGTAPKFLNMRSFLPGWSVMCMPVCLGMWVCCWSCAFIANTAFHLDYIFTQGESVRLLGRGSDLPQSSPHTTTVSRVYVHIINM